MTGLTGVVSACSGGGGDCDSSRPLLLDTPAVEGVTALLLAAEAGHVACVRSLLQAGANAHAKTLVSRQMPGKW